MKVLVIGGGGREHTLAWKLAQSPRVERVYCAPGNPGVAALAKGVCADIGVLDFPAQAALITQEGIELVVIGPEDPLAAGAADTLAKTGAKVFGPCAAAARLEASKTFAKQFMAQCNIPTAGYAEFDNSDAAIAYVRAQGAPIVIKADGLAAGKGVTVAHDVEAAEAAIAEAMLDKVFGDAGGKIIIEEFMEGEEASILAFADGKTVVAMASAQDHKPVFDSDRGPNTGGMGAYSPAPVVTLALSEQIQREVLEPCIRGMAEAGTPYVGVLYAGLMITADGPRVVEFNCRFGDPETQAVLPRMTSDLVDIMEACCDGRLDSVAIEYDERPCVTVVLASGGYPGAYEKGKAITGIADAEALGEVTVFHAGTKMAGDALVTNGGRVLAVSALDADLPATIKKAYAAVEKVGFEGAHSRSDIGAKALRRD